MADAVAAFLSGETEAGADCGVAGAGAAVAAAACAGAAEARASDASRTTITFPSLTLSPSLTFTSLITPAEGEGTSMVAFSDSSVTSESSAFTVSPGLTRTSITGTSLKSPMSGTLTSILCAAPSTGLTAAPRYCCAGGARDDGEEFDVAAAVGAADAGAGAAAA